MPSVLYRSPNCAFLRGGGVAFYQSHLIVDLNGQCCALPASSHHPSKKSCLKYLAP